jgi:hypothetical protein
LARRLSFEELLKEIFGMYGMNIIYLFSFFLPLYYICSFLVKIELTNDKLKEMNGVPVMGRHDSKIRSFFVDCMHLLCFFFFRKATLVLPVVVSGIFLSLHGTEFPVRIDARTNDEVDMLSLMES